MQSEAMMDRGNKDRGTVSRVHEALFEWILSKQVPYYSFSPLTRLKLARITLTLDMLFR